MRRHCTNVELRMRELFEDRCAAEDASFRGQRPVSVDETRRNPAYLHLPSQRTYERGVGYVITGDTFNDGSNAV